MTKTEPRDMKCKACQYALWNLRSRVCPECGSTFAPSEFEFAANSVRFMCPHCAQAYYGIGERGHLVPEEFACVKCRRQVHMDEMVLLPTEGVSEDQTAIERSPWLEVRGKRPFPWVRTVMWAMFQPRRLIRGTPRDARVWSALWFALVTNGVYVAIGLAPIMLWMLYAMVRGLSVGAVGIFAVLGLMVLGIGAVSVGVWALVSHGLLRATGPTDETLGRTLQAICYASAGNVLVAVPCLGVYTALLGVLWWVVAATIMAGTMHRVSVWRAIACVAVPPLVVVALVISVLVLWMISIVSTITAAVPGPMPPTMVGAPGPIPSSPALDALSRPTQTKAVLEALLSYGREHEGAGPDHAARLVNEGRLSPQEVLAGGSGTSIEQVIVGGSPLGEVGVDGVGLSAAVDRAAAGLPADVAAYRVGDYVFTYPGIDLLVGDADLWVVVCAPDQEAPGAVRMAGVPVAVGRLGGTVTPIAGTAFGEALDEQNALRARHGLGPLPDPALVRGEEPMGGGK